MKRSAINIKNLSVEFGDGFKALDRVSAKIEPGKITGLIGPSGAGKTTMMRCIVGRQIPTSGNITIFGKTTGSAELRSQVSYKTQEASSYKDLTVTQNLNYFAGMMNVRRRDRKSHVTEIIKTMDLQPQSKQLVSSLSGGQRQRVSLGIAMIGNPKLLILDEPTVGLDPVLRDDLWSMFKKLAKQGTSILVSSHVMDEAERCNDLILIRGGKIVAHDTPSMMRRRAKVKTVEAAFLKLARGGEA